jgi:hypothetical protein
MPFISDSYREQFFKYIAVIPDHPCHEWTASKDKDGYGSFSFKHPKTGRYIHRGAHRVAYYFYYGDFDQSLCVCHACDNRGCQRPEHLFLDTNVGNTADKVSKNRQARGNKVIGYRPRGVESRSSKLTEQDVNEIRQKYAPRKYSSIRLAKEYGVEKPTILSIIKYKTWKHI